MAIRRTMRLGGERAIVDRAALARRLAKLEGGDAGDGREALVDLLKSELARGQAELCARLEGGESGAQLVAAQSTLIDGILEALLDFQTRRVWPEAGRADRLALVGVGGYGRAELAPYSDIDLVFLLPRKRTDGAAETVEFVLRLLWDMGLKVGHATRTVDECIERAGADMTIRTTLLEARSVWGGGALFRELRRRFDEEIVKGSQAEFIAAKLAERDARHRKTGDSRYLLEPNLKESKGGLRDLHCLFWIAKYLYRVERFQELVGRGVISRREYSRFAKAEEFLWRVRAHLHLLAGRAEDRLTFDLQPEMARRMGFHERSANTAVERFMKRYFLVAKDVGELTRIFCAQLEAEHLREAPGKSAGAGLGLKEPDGFAVEGGRLSVESGRAFERRPVRMIRLFHLAQERELDVHPRALRLIQTNLKRIDGSLRKDPEANALFVEILTSPKDPETALRRMNEAGVLGRFLPDFGRIVGQVQYDMYHVYTVDEHTIRAIGILAGIEQGRLGDELPLASRIVHQVISRRVPYLALLFHDLAKGRGGSHSDLGAGLAQKLARRLGFTPEEAETVSWLVRHHLIFSDTAFKRDINEPETVREFAAAVQSIERLRLLLLVTVADIRAVGPGRWNGWKGALLRDLYDRAKEVISGGHQAEAKAPRVAFAADQLRKRLADWPAQAIEAHLQRLPPPYWLTFDEAAHERHARMMRAADEKGASFALLSRVDRFRAVTEITLYAADHPGLFAEVAGAMAMSEASIVDAKIFTTEDGRALDSFWVQDADGSAFEGEERLMRLPETLERALTGGIALDEALKRRRVRLGRSRVFPIEPRVLVDNKTSSRHTLIEVNGRDRPGLLYAVTRALTHLGLTIVTAHITTYGERAVDVFYVKDHLGLKITDETRVEALRGSLIEALAEPDAAQARGSGPRRAAVG